MPQNIHPQSFIIRPPEGLVQSRPDLRRLGAHLAQKYADRELVTDDDLRAVGGALWMALGLDASFQTARQEAGMAILPIIVESASAEIQALPWETLHHPELGFLGIRPEFTLTRRLAAPPAKPRHPEKGPLKVLLFTSLPDDLDAETGRLNVELEQEKVQEALLPLISQGLVRLEMPDDGRFSTFKQFLKSFQPHLVFLSGHGRFHHQPHTGEMPYGVFLFEGEAGEGQPVRDGELAGAFAGSRVQGVVVSACESGKATSEALNNGLMQKLGELGIPLVIGMRESIMDIAGIQFTRTLGDEIARQERLDCALQTARAAIQTPPKDIARREADPGGLSELSMGQWCLPMLLAPEPGLPLVDWDFPLAHEHNLILSASLDTVSLPAHFIGRRAELRQYKQQVLSGKIQKLLITGPGGQGKTALAGKLMYELKACGYGVFAWSARLENPWRSFQFDLESALTGNLATTYDRQRIRVENESEHAELLLSLLTRQYEGKMALLLDNLESLQDPETLSIRDARLAAWLETARRLPGVTLIATSRWLLPGWDGAHLPLTRVSYGDFLQMAQRLADAGRFSKDFLKNRGNMRRVYAALGGNGRGLETFAGALAGLGGLEDENTFLERLARVQEETQVDMAITMIVEHLPVAARSLLARLPAYPRPVPVEGILKLAEGLPGPEALLARLAAVSLLEQRYEAEWDVLEYSLAPLVADWLRQNKLADPALHWLEAAADYEVYLFRYERKTLSQAIRAHNALRQAGRQSQADRLTLDNIIGPLNRAGFYRTLLDDWLPQPCQSDDPAIRGEALGQAGKQYLDLGDYETALAYLKQALTIRQQIGDKAGEGATLNNISQIFKAQGDYETALAYMKQSLTICQQIGDKAGEGTTLNNISALFHAQGDYETALAYLKQALTIRQQIGDKAGEGTTLNNISQIFKAQGDYETALAYLKQSLTIRQQIGDKAGEGATLNNMGSAYLRQGDYETALAYLKQALTIMQQIGDKAGEGTTLNNTSQIYDAQGDYETALAYLKQSLTIRQQIGDKAGLCVTLFNMGHIYAQKKDIQAALDAWVRAYRIAKSIHLAQVLKALADLAPGLGLPPGLDGWEILAKRMENAEDKLRDEAESQA